MGIMWGPYLVELMPNFNLNGMFGMLLIVVSTVMIGLLQTKHEKFKEQRTARGNTTLSITIPRINI